MRRAVGHRLLGAALGAAALSQPATAQPCQGAEFQGLSVQVENDLFSFYHHTDRWYTNGIFASAAWKAACAPNSLRPLSQLGGRMLGRPNVRNMNGEPATLSLLLGQNMYTPRDITIAAPQPNDRPWGGWLFAGLAANAVVSDQEHRYMDAKLGVIGPPSLARETQTEWHALIRAPQPQGWANQLRPRLGAQLSYLQTNRIDGPGPLEKLGLNFAWGASLGNTRTQAKAGLTAVWPSSPGPAGLADEGDFILSDYSGQAAGTSRITTTRLFAQVQVSAVAYNGFLQGDTFAGYADISVKRLVATGAVGISVPLDLRGRHRVTYTLKRRSPEFTSNAVSSRDAVQTWGSITYVYTFE